MPRYKRNQRPITRAIPLYTRAYAARKTGGYTRRRYIGTRRAAARITGLRSRTTMVSRYVGRGAIRQRAAFLRAGDMAVARLRAGMKLSPCVDKWLKSILNPFDGPLDACNPYCPPVYSERMRLWARFPFIPSDRKSDSVPGLPVPLMVFAAPGSDGWFTVAPPAVAASYSETTSFPTYCASAYPNNSPLTTASFSAQNSFAIVSMGLRVRYTGNADSMNGFIGLFEDPNHDNLMATGTYNQQHIHQDSAYKIVPVSTDWVTIVWSGPRTNMTASGLGNYGVKPGPQDEMSYSNTYPGLDPSRLRSMRGPQVTPVR